MSVVRQIEGEMLALQQVLGNTWCLMGQLCIPLYKVNETDCVLLDTGLISERQGIENVLAENGLRPVGILGSHIHTDHSPNHAYFQKKYHLPVALPEGEAGLCSTLLNIKAYLFMLTPAQTASEEDAASMLVKTDRAILQDETEIEFCGARFGILRTPGHSPDHIAIRTPDDVLYLGDSLLTADLIEKAKLPYFFAIEEAIASMEKLRGERAACCLAAHRGIVPDMPALIRLNEETIRDRAEQICRLVDHPLTQGQLYEKVCAHFGLRTSNISRAALYERNVRIYLDYLRDTGMVSTFAKEGCLYFAPAEEEQA